MPSKKMNGCTFLVEDFLVGVGKTAQRTIGVSGRMTKKRKNVDEGSIPEPLSGTLPSGLGLDRGHVIAEELGGPNISENIVPMYSYFNRRGTWKGMERQLKGVLGERPYVGIMIDYDASRPWLPRAFRIQTGTSEVGLPFYGNGNEIPGPGPLEMRLHLPVPYPGDAEVRKRIQAVLPAKRDPFTPYAFMDAMRNAWGLRPILKTERFNDLEREYVKVANSLFDRDDAKEKGFLISDSLADPHRILNHMGNEDFPEVDHVAPFSWGGENAFANAQLLSWKHNSAKRAVPSDSDKKRLLDEAEKMKEHRLRNKKPKTQ